MVHASSGLVEPPSPELKSEVAIVCGMARATLPDSGIDWEAFEGDYTLIRDKIEAVFPVLFADFNARHPRTRRLPSEQRPARPDLGDGKRHRQTSWSSRGWRRIQRPRIPVRFC